VPFIRSQSARLGLVAALSPPQQASASRVQLVQLLKLSLELLLQRCGTGTRMGAARVWAAMTAAVVVVMARRAADISGCREGQ
jgi:hypothetical protein